MKKITKKIFFNNIGPVPLALLEEIGNVAEVVAAAIAGGPADYADDTGYERCTQSQRGLLKPRLLQTQALRVN